MTHYAQPKHKISNKVPLLCIRISTMALGRPTQRYSRSCNSWGCYFTFINQECTASLTPCWQTPLSRLLLPQLLQDLRRQACQPFQLLQQGQLHPWLRLPASGQLHAASQPPALAWAAPRTWGCPGRPLLSASLLAPAPSVQPPDWPVAAAHASMDIKCLQRGLGRLSSSKLHCVAVASLLLRSCSHTLKACRYMASRIHAVCGPSLDLAPCHEYQRWQSSCIWGYWRAVIVYGNLLPEAGQAKSQGPGWTHRQSTPSTAAGSPTPPCSRAPPGCRTQSRAAAGHA